MPQKLVSVYFLIADTKLSIYSLTCQLEHSMQFSKPSQAVEIKIGFVTCIPRLFPHTDTRHQPVEAGEKALEMTQQIRTFFHTHQGMLMWNESGGVSISMSTNFSNSVNTNFWFKSHLNGIIK
jgi:hypothetical protein